MLHFFSKVPKVSTNLYSNNRLLILEDNGIFIGGDCGTVDEKLIAKAGSAV